ncbi:MAG: hypothetical protein WCA84_16715 [Ignavibacteriaceae bacterium]|jgi:hypothetical protein
MITAIIFSAHLLFALIIYTKKWQIESISSAWLNVGLIGILFSVGWTITGMIAPMLMDPKGLGIFFDRDTFSLTLLSIGEFFFYLIYYKDVFVKIEEDINEAGMEKQ